MSKLSYEEQLAAKKEKTSASAKKSRGEKSKLVKNGAYSIIVTLIVIAIVAAINLIVHRLPASYTELDISKNNYFTLSEKSIEIADRVKDDVTLYYLVENGAENVYIEGLLSQYEGTSKHIKVEKIDPVAYPTFASEYTDSSLSQNSVIVVSGDKSKVINYSEMFEVDTSVSQQTGQPTTTVTGFDGEGRITSALAYVSAESLPVAYELTGHGETALADIGVKEFVDKENIELKTLSLIADGKIPEDCAAVIINAPLSDISADESSMLKEYIANGGKLVILTIYNGESQPDIKGKLPNLTSVIAEFGIEPVKGIIIENSSSNYYSNQMYLLPKVNSTDIAGSLFTNGRYILAPYSSGIKTLDNKPEDLNVTAILSTSDDSFSKVDAGSGTMTQVPDDINGPFDIAVGVTNSANSSKLIYFTSAFMLDPSIDAYVSGANSELFANALALTVGNESSVSIPVKSLEPEQIMVDNFKAGIIKAVTQYIIPLLLVITGAVVWYIRRKK
ncbi:MAG: Gldg family protein [Lachnospiraceae bacterium]|nr:Gldg family protein [Lachnospiraceae bacterium]